MTAMYDNATSYFSLNGRPFYSLSCSEFNWFNELRKTGIKNNLFATVLFETHSDYIDIHPGMTQLQRDQVLRATNSKVFVFSIEGLNTFIWAILEKYQSKYEYIKEALDIYKTASDLSEVRELLSRTIDNVDEQDEKELGQLEVLLSEISGTAWAFLSKEIKRMFR